MVNTRCWSGVSMVEERLSEAQTFWSGFSGWPTLNAFSRPFSSLRRAKRPVERHSFSAHPAGGDNERQGMISQ